MVGYMLQTKAFNSEVLYPDEEYVIVSALDVAVLKQMTIANPRKRIRLCAHPTVENSLHEMLILHTNETYVRPHKHLNKSESLHVVEGQADVVFFDEVGLIQKVVSLGPYAEGGMFYYRIEQPWFHTLVIYSDIFIFHEVTNGPFDVTQTVFPSWAPENDDLTGQAVFLDKLSEQIHLFRGASLCSVEKIF